MNDGRTTGEMILVMATICRCELDPLGAALPDMCNWLVALTNTCT